MIKNALILITLNMLGLFANGQSTIKFNKKYSFFDTNPSTSGYLSVNVFKQNNDYILGGIITTATIDGGFGIIRTDSVGEIKYQKLIGQPNNLRITNNTANQAFIQLQNKNLLFTGQNPIVLNYTKACLAHINHNTGDTLWTKQYTQPGDTCYLLCSTELSDSSIIVFGFRYYTCITCNNNSKPFMMKVDKNGNYKWHKWINPTFTNTQYLFQKVIKLSDNDFVVVGNKWSGVNNGFIMRIDTMANKLYNLNTNVSGVNNHAFNDFIQLSNGNFLIGGVYYTSTGKDKKLLYQFNLNSGAKIKHKIYNVEANANGILTLAQKPNGTIIAFGGTGATSPVNTYNMQGDFLWLNSNLDSLRSVYIETPNVADHAVPNQAILTPDGGFAAVIASYPNASQQQYWLIKADSNGCYQSLCPTVGLNDVSLSGVENGIKIYPNPAKDLLYVEVSHAERSRSVTSETPTSFSLTNALGQVIKEEVLRELQQPIEIDVKDLPNGVYFLQLKSSQTLIKSKKVVIEK